MDSKDVQSPGSSLVIKNSACNLFYEEGFRASFLQNIRYASHLLLSKQSSGSLCNKVQYLGIFDKSSAFQCADMSPDRHTVDTQFIYIIYIIYKKRSEH